MYMFNPKFFTVHFKGKYDMNNFQIDHSISKVWWQQAAGDGNRSYADLCLEWDVILNGPGDFGPWPKCQEDLKNEKWMTRRKLTDLWRFCEEMNDGDFVILKIGTKEVYGVGQVVGDYEHHEEFNDIDGWCLAHVRRVHWLWKYGEDGPKDFENYTFNWGDTTQKFNYQEKAKVREWLDSLNLDSTNDSVRELPKYSKKKVKHESISEFLFNKGVDRNTIKSLLDQFDGFHQITNFYYSLNDAPSEHETVTHLVIPLLRSLGWTPQKMAIEFPTRLQQKIDVALFENLPREQNSFAIVVEVKKFSYSCMTKAALEQAKKYASNSENCRQIILTDGIRYGVFNKNFEETNSESDFELKAYMNLRRLREDYPLYHCKGVQDALLAMVP